ncbi:MAG: hypothetical protein QY323_05970 [Patescibacteria group bacterium]|nr:MAG: hypothetical protein QY323_05970 [Patescibacteria group bacterium]
MSLWRVKHALSPSVEAALISVVVAYGLFVVWYASLSPLAVPMTAVLATVPQPVSLDTDEWTRRDEPSRGFAFALPVGWLVDDTDPSHVRLGRSVRELATAAAANEGILMETVPLGAREEIANLVAEDFAGTRPALYDVYVDGRHALFVLTFERNRVRRQAVYVPMGEEALVIRAATTDPAVFATFVSTIKFYKP